MIPSKVSHITPISLTSQHTSLTSRSHHRSDQKSSDHVVVQWPLSAPRPHQPHYFFYQSRLIVIGHHRRYHYQLVMLLLLPQQQHTLSSHHVLMLMLHRSGTAAAMLIFRPRLHLMAQNWPKCKIHSKKGVVVCGPDYLFIATKIINVSSCWGCVFQSTSKQPIEARRHQSNHQIPHNNQLTNESEIEIQ